MLEQSTTPTFRYTQLAAKARMAAMNEVRDFIDALVAERQAEYAKAQSKSFNEATDSLALASKTAAIQLNLLTAKDFKSNIDDDFNLLTFMKLDTLDFLESGDIVKTSFSANKLQPLVFSQYQGDFYNKYQAESDDFYYVVIKMHSSRDYTARRQHKTDNTPIIETEHSSLSSAFGWLQEHHANKTL